MAGPSDFLFCSVIVKLQGSVNTDNWSMKQKPILPELSIWAIAIGDNNCITTRLPLKVEPDQQISWEINELLCMNIALHLCLILLFSVINKISWSRLIVPQSYETVVILCGHFMAKRDDFWSDYKQCDTYMNEFCLFPSFTLTACSLGGFYESCWDRRHISVRDSASLLFP